MTIVSMTSDLPSGSESAYTYEFDYKPAGRRTPNQPDGNDSDGWKNTIFLYWGTDNWNDRSNQVTLVTWDDNNYMNAGHGTHGDPVSGTNTQYIRARLRSADIGCRVIPPGWTYDECVAGNPWDVTYTGPGYDLSDSNSNLVFHRIRVTRESSVSSNPNRVTVYVDGRMVAQRAQVAPSRMPQCGGTSPPDECRRLYILGRPARDPSGVPRQEVSRSMGTMKNIKIWSSVVPPPPP